MTKLVADQAGVRQAQWVLATKTVFAHNPDMLAHQVEARFSYPVFVKPAGTGSSVGVSKARDRADLLQALETAFQYDKKVLVEEFIDGQEVECAVLGNDTPMASVCGEIDSGADFYDYEAKYVSDSSRLYIPARIDDAVAEEVRETSVKIYEALGCCGLSRVGLLRHPGRARWSSTRSTPSRASRPSPCTPSSSRPAAFPIPS